MAESFQVTLDWPDDLPSFQLPPGVQTRLTELLDRQDRGQPLNDAERNEAEGLVQVAEVLSLLKLRARRAAE